MPKVISSGNALRCGSWWEKGARGKQGAGIHPKMCHHNLAQHCHSARDPRHSSPGRVSTGEWCMGCEQDQDGNRSRF